jgi:serine/threonine protein phosphatase PrpC
LASRRVEPLADLSIMGCSTSALAKEPVPKLRRRFSVGEVDEKSQDEDSNFVSDEDRSAILDLGQAQILDVVKTHKMSSNKYCISSETDEQGCSARPSSDKSVKIVGADKFPSHEGMGFVCKKGLKPEAPNQDSFFLMKVDEEYSLYGVFDGHGRTGHDVSNFVKDNLPKILFSQEKLDEEPKSVLLETFAKTQYLIEKATQMKHIDASRSGTTCSVVLHMHRKNMLYVAHVGDSRVVLGKQGKSKNGAPVLVAVDLTIDHKPDLPEEKRRIEAAGGQVLFDGWNHRVYAKGKKDARGKRYPGLNMSRAMGDLKGFHEAGISAEPDVQARSLKSFAGAPGAEPKVTAVDLDPSVDKFVILSSDGVWEFISSQEAVQMVGAFPAQEAAQAAEHLAVTAWDRWMQELEGEVVDDITAVVAHFPTHDLTPVVAVT